MRWLMKTTVMIDDKLLADAIKAINAHTKKEAIEAGLRELVRKKNIHDFSRELGTFDMAMDLEELQRLRNGG
jgi:Arc/MetJ family transcription regulator